MIKIKYLLAVVLLVTISLVSCSDNDNALSEPMLIVKFKFDSTQARLNNLGQPASISSGFAAQTPVFNTISANYLELAPNAITQLGQGVIVYHAPETNLGGTAAIDFSQSKIVAEGETFLKIPLRLVASGNYEWMRVSLSYQNYQISIRNQNVDYLGTLSSFIGFNTYIGTHAIGNNIFPVNGNRSQGYWAFALNTLPYSSSGLGTPNATTVSNPRAAYSPISAESGVVTGKFPTNLVISGKEKKDIVITLNLSINQSFEWTEVISDGKYEPSIGENAIDMGLRRLTLTYTK